MWIVLIYLLVGLTLTVWAYTEIEVKWKKFRKQEKLRYQGIKLENQIERPDIDLDDVHIFILFCILWLPVIVFGILLFILRWIFKKILDEN